LRNNLIRKYNVSACVDMLLSHYQSIL